MVFCGIDIGTTGTKAVVLAQDGHVLDEAAFLAPVGAGAAGAAYWHDHFCRVMDFFVGRDRFVGEEIVCSVTGQGGSFAFLDEQYRPVGAACSWTTLAEDAAVCDLRETLGETAYYHLTGWPPHGWLAACKLRQKLENRQLPYEARYLATVPDFIYVQLTGKLSTDVTSAQITGLADFEQAQWSRDIVDWAGLQAEWLPPILPGLRVVAEGVRTGWGRLTLVSGSHDQYAAMEAAGLRSDASVMLGTGTAWVLNGRTGRPRFDDERLLIHPGRDLHPDRYGFIVTLWQIGAGFDRLLVNLGLTQSSLASLEDALAEEDIPRERVTVDLDAGTVKPTGEACLSVRRYMEWSGAEVAHALEDCGLGRGLEKVIVTGGAMKSQLWPQVLADICDLTVEAIDYPHFTAYGAGLHARAAVLGAGPTHRFPATAAIRTYAPQQAQRYRGWYEAVQRRRRTEQGE
jgi:sugar (pentulose or hexulose) kinase